MTRRLACALVVVAVTAASGPAAGAESHPFGVHDLLAMERLSDPRVSPDGARVAFVLRSTDLAANRGRTDLWLVGADGQGLRRLTSHEAGDSNPRWAPDGKSLYFLSTRSGSSQVWRLPIDGGEPWQVTRLGLDVANLEVSPDGRRLAFSLEVFHDCDTIECTEKRLAEKEERKASGRLYERLFVRHWDTWKDGRRSHLFTWVPGEPAEPVDLTKGVDADVPSKPFGGSEEFAFSPDGTTVVFTARVAGREEAWSTNFDLYSAPADGGEAPRLLTGQNPAADTQPLFSPDGRFLAYLAQARPGYESDRYVVMLRDQRSGATRPLTALWDRSPGELAFAADGKTLYATAEDRGQKPLFAIDAVTGRVRQLAGDGTLHTPRPAAGGRIVFGREHLRSPVELWSVAAAGGEARQLTAVNAARLAAARLGEPEQMSFPGWNGETVHAWVVKPADFDAARKYPVAFLIHGGPQGSFGNQFHYRWNPQPYAGRGYGVVMVDFHGSSGYGQAFTDSIRGDWGGKPLEDLQKGLDAALERYPWLDGGRACALGASYGAYMINWMAGAWSDPFRCFVSHDGNLDERGAYYMTEELWFPEWDHEGTPWENPAGYAKHNPMDHVASWKTPTLVVHGALDYRVVDTQGLASFTALQRRGIPSKLLYFPDENHWVLKPQNSIQWHETVLSWLDQWTRE
jgi:dipeptidyl aminopeptidase/acylaminoacyl peptidase